jgi:hypothetical protein
MVIFWLYDEPIQSELFRVHVYLEDVRRIIEFPDFKYDSTAFFSTISLQLSDVFRLPLLFGQLSLTIRLQMLVKPLLLSFFSLLLNFTWIEYELILHHNCHIANSEFSLFRFNQPELDHIILFHQFFSFSFSFQFLFLIFSQIHRHDNVLVILIFIPDFLISDLIVKLQNVEILLNLEIIYFLLNILAF